MEYSKLNNYLDSLNNLKIDNKLNNIDDNESNIDLLQLNLNKLEKEYNKVKNDNKVKCLERLNKYPGNLGE